MRVYLTREFDRFASRNAISDGALCEAVARAERGLVDADLGGAVIKQRVARCGQGRSGGFRTVMIYRAGDLALFVHGFAKNAKANLTKLEQEQFREFGKRVLTLADEAFDALIAERKWRGLVCEG